MRATGFIWDTLWQHLCLAPKKAYQLMTQIALSIQRSCLPSKVGKKYPTIPMSHISSVAQSYVYSKCFKLLRFPPNSWYKTQICQLENPSNLNSTNACMQASWDIHKYGRWWMHDSNCITSYLSLLKLEFQVFKFAFHSVLSYPLCSPSDLALSHMCKK